MIFGFRQIIGIANCIERLVSFNQLVDDGSYRPVSTRLAEHVYSKCKVPRACLPNSIIIKVGCFPNLWNYNWCHRVFLCIKCDVSTNITLFTHLRMTQSQNFTQANTFTQQTRENWTEFWVMLTVRFANFQMLKFPITHETTLIL